MDTVSHLVAGALTPLAFSRMPKRTALVVFGIAAGEFPDIDTLFSRGTAEGLLELHRGITHALFWQPVFAVALVFTFYLFLSRHKRVATQNPHPSPSFGLLAKDAGIPGGGLCEKLTGVSLWNMLLIALLALYVHLYLDCMTTFGTKIFLPFSDTRVLNPAMFIVDPFLLVPAACLLLFALRKPADIAPVPGVGDVAFFSRRAQQLARLGLLWIVLYPLISLGINHAAVLWYEKKLNAVPGSVKLVTEPFSPLVWKLVRDDGDSYAMGTVFLLASDHQPRLAHYAKVDRKLFDNFAEQVSLFRYFRGFCTDMIQTTRPFPSGKTGRPGALPADLTLYTFGDLRYIMSEQSPAHWVGRDDTYFVLEALVTDGGVLTAYRFLKYTALEPETPWIAVR